MIAFSLFYGFLSKRTETAPPTDAAPSRGAVKSLRRVPWALALVVCVLVVGVAAPGAYASVENLEAATPATLVVKRFLLFLPTATLLILLHETVSSGRKVLFSRVCVLLLLLVLVFITENTYTEKRNAIGPVYIGLLLVLFQTWFAARQQTAAAARGQHGRGVSGDRGIYS